MNRIALESSKVNKCRVERPGKQFKRMKLEREKEPQNHSESTLDPNYNPTLIMKNKARKEWTVCPNFIQKIEVPSFSRRNSL